MAGFEFKIEEGVEIPKREMNFGPRGSKYPLLDMKEGQSFALQIVGKEGQKDGKGNPLTAKEDALRKARQKQSYFSSFGKRNGIKVVTRFNEADGTLRVWHDGKAEAKPDAGDAGKDAADTQTAQTAQATGAAGSTDMELD